MSVGCLSKLPVPLHVALRVPRSSASTLITLQVPRSISTTPCSALWPRDLLVRFLRPGSLHRDASRAAALSCSPCRMHPCLTMPSLHPALQGCAVQRWALPRACKEKDPLSGRYLIICEFTKVLFHFLEWKWPVVWHVLERCDFCSSCPHLCFGASPNLAC